MMAADKFPDVFAATPSAAVLEFMHGARETSERRFSTPITFNFDVTKDGLVRALAFLRDRGFITINPEGGKR